MSNEKAQAYWDKNKQPLRDVAHFEGTRGVVYQVFRDLEAELSGLTNPPLYASWRTLERGRRLAKAGDFRDIHMTNAEAIQSLRDQVGSLIAAQSAQSEPADFDLDALMPKGWTRTPLSDEARGAGLSLSSRVYHGKDGVNSAKGDAITLLEWAIINDGHAWSYGATPEAEQ